MFGENLGNQRLVGFGGRGAKRETDFAEAQLEQPVAAPGLAVVIPLRRRPCENLDLPVIEAEPPVDRGDLRLDGPLVRQQCPSSGILRQLAA